MSKKRRDLKRLAAHAHNDLDRALYNLKALHDEFEGIHEDHATLLQNMAEGLMVAQDGIKTFWRLSWGKPPDKIGSYKG